MLRSGRRRSGTTLRGRAAYFRNLHISGTCAPVDDDGIEACRVGWQAGGHSDGKIIRTPLWRNYALWALGRLRLSGMGCHVQLLLARRACAGGRRQSQSHIADRLAARRALPVVARAYPQQRQLKAFEMPRNSTPIGPRCFASRASLAAVTSASHSN